MNNLEVIRNHIPNIIKEAEERKYKVIVKSAQSLEKYLDKIGDKYNQAEKYVYDMNDACNDMFNFMKDNKLGKTLKNTIIETILATYHINQVYNCSVTYIKQYDNGRYEGEMVDGKREGKGKFFFITGDYYEGEFKNNAKEGYGKYVYNNKDVYEGEYKEGKMQKNAKE